LTRPPIAVALGLRKRPILKGKGEELLGIALARLEGGGDVRAGTYQSAPERIAAARERT
jgi:hypothetical protein